MSAPPKHYEQIFTTCMTLIKPHDFTEKGVNNWATSCVNLYSVASQLVNKGMAEAAQNISRISEE